MKRIIIILSFSMLPILAGAQDFIDDLFRKYSGNDGFTSIVINKDLLDFAFIINNDKDIDKLKGKISDLRILISDEHQQGNNSTFKDEIKNSITKNNYQCLIEILDGKNKVNFYVKKDNDKIIHLILIASENNEEVLLSLKGQFTMKELIEMGKDSNHQGSFHHLSYLTHLDE
ncbi:MAG: DUF4252 domain-containing protein [Bacteroidales bacterium]|nr:DUF4252 domain-containing protein [Bacteroidales bacterium]